MLGWSCVAWAEASARFWTEASRKSTCRSSRLSRSFNRPKRRRVAASADTTHHSTVPSDHQEGVKGASSVRTEGRGEGRGQWREGRLTEFVEESDDFADVVLNVGNEVSSVPVDLDRGRHRPERDGATQQAITPCTSCNDTRTSHTTAGPHSTSLVEGVSDEAEDRREEGTAVGGGIRQVMEDRGLPSLSQNALNPRLPVLCPLSSVLCPLSCSVASHLPLDCLPPIDRRSKDFTSSPLHHTSR